jgi:hypothetical protein
VVFRQASADVSFAFSFRAGSTGVGPATFSLKQSRCPHCGCTESLNRHSFLSGNDPSTAAAKCQRGQRVFCSNRGQRGGCGRTFSLVFADVLPRHTMTASLLWPWLVALLAGGSVKAAVEKFPLSFVLETFYQLRRKLQHKLDQVRSRLCQKQPPPASTHTDPLLQTVEHLQQTFAGTGCPLAEFQLHFQHSFLG